MMEYSWYSKPMSSEVPYNVIQDKSPEFHKWNFEPFDLVEYGYEDVMDKLKSYTAVEYLEYEKRLKDCEEAGDEEGAAKWKAEMNRMVDEVYEIYRSKGIYPTAYYSEMGILSEIEKCIDYKAKFDGDTVSCGAGVGSTLCKFLFPNLQDTPSKHDLDKKGAESIFAKFNNEQFLKRAIRFCFGYKNGCPVPTAVEGGLRLVGSAPSNFRPMNAKAVYERFCPENGVIYDPCCVDGDTEYFNGKEWVKIESYKEGDKVLQFTSPGEGCDLVYPEEYIHYANSKPFYDIDGMLLTGNHDVVHYDIENGGKKLIKTKVDDLKEEGTLYIPKTGWFYLGENEIKPSMIDILKLYFSVVVVGSEYSEGFSKYAYQDVNGDIVISDDVYRFDTVSKQILLNLFRLYGDERDIRCSDGESVENKSVSFDSMFLGELPIKVQHTLEGLYNSVYFGQHMWVWGDEDKTVQIAINDEKEYQRIYYSKEEVQFEDKYCFVVPSHMLVLRRNGKVFVTGNCGFGGRMLGALSSTKNFKYVGTDPCTETMYHLHELGEYIEMATGREESYELHCCGSEDFKGKPNSIDFAFTSPPYFDLEVYSTEETQCYNKFPNLKDWLEGYVRQTIKNIYVMLKPGRVYAINIADFKVHSGETVAYVDEWIRISGEEGMPLFDTVYLGVTARAGSRQQANGEMKKENILIFKKPL